LSMYSKMWCCVLTEPIVECFTETIRAFAAVVCQQSPGSLRVVGSRKKNSHPRRSTTGRLLSFLLDSVVVYWQLTGVDYQYTISLLTRSQVIEDPPDAFFFLR
jgi:hypothetical protein